MTRETKTEIPEDAATAPPSEQGLVEPEENNHPPTRAGRWGLLAMSLGALGVVYGDIGTSPLYAFRESFVPPFGVAKTPENVLGLLSLFFWALTLVVGVKYLIFVMRADNQGEGGILALLALVAPKDKPERKTRARALLVGLGLFGAALLAADGMITPTITVLGAIEGLEVATSHLEPFVEWIAIAILVGLFLVQRHGTGRIAAVFGPAMLVWFLCISAVAAPWIVREPRVLTAFNPWHAVVFFQHNHLHGVLVLGAVVLCVTGTEALYADMGHFGKQPIRLAWFAVAFPALLTNYFGQGAYVLAHAAGDARGPFNPFYALAGDILLYPMVIIATVAAIIASQALISGAFSLAQQAVHMGYSPRLTVVHTSSKTRGQIYVPRINTALMIACVVLVLGFQRSTHLAAAYGIAVMGTMTITSILLFVVMRRRWRWSLARAGALTALFVAVDLTFFSANIDKIWHGGWFPLVVAAGVFTIMSTWKAGRERLYRSLREATLPLDKFLSSVERDPPHRVPGTAVFMTSNPEGTPVVLMHHFKHNKVLHERVVLLCAVSEDVPEVPADQRVTIRDRGQGFFQAIARYGFMQTPNIAEIFRACTKKGLKLHPREASFYLGRETLIITDKPGMARWRKILFEFQSRNARSATAYFDIPPNRVVELGTQIEL
jgi:KUP system potassium uptake protein